MKKSEIPKNIEECYQFLDQLEVKDLNEWLGYDLDKAIGISHHTYGRWIRNSFELWEEPANDLKQWFIDNYFIENADDISGLILIYFHQKKNGKTPDLLKYIKKYHKHWEQCDPNFKLKLRKYKWKKIYSNLVK